VPVEIVNISLKVQLLKQTYVGVASPITVRDTRDIVGYDVNAIQRDSTEQGNFDGYLKEKLAHLKGEDRSMLESALRRYNHLFYVLKSKELGCTAQVKQYRDRGRKTY
jgi:hypothetical protein